MNQSDNSNSPPASGAREARCGLVKGRVQGVFFRVETQARARRLGLSGWVRNTPEGHVEVLICGDSAALATMQAWLASGPALARVDSLELTRCQDPGLKTFEIRD